VQALVYNTHVHLHVQNLFVLLAYLGILELLAKHVQLVVLVTVMMDIQVVVDALVYLVLMDQIVNTQIV